MMKFFAQMLRFPITVFISTMEVFVGAMRDVQTNTDRTINTMVDGFGQALGSAPGSQSGPGSCPPGTTHICTAELECPTLVTLLHKCSSAARMPNVGDSFQIRYTQSS